MKNGVIGKGIFWSLGFVVIFLLSQDYIFFNWQLEVSWMGFPTWLYWFVMVHIVLIGFFYWFSKRFWNE